MSLGQLYQGGWTIDKDGKLQLQSPGSEVRIPVEFKNRSFAIKQSPWLDRLLMLDNAWHLSAMMSWQ